MNPPLSGIELQIMAEQMSQSSLVHLLLVLTMGTYADTITCSSSGECIGQTLTCTSTVEDTCNVYCGENACQLSVIHCNDGALCRIEVNGFEAARQAKIHGHSASRLEIITEGTSGRQLAEANITCPDSGECYVLCNANSYQVCHSLFLRGEQSNKVQLVCEESANEGCNSVDVWCPTSGTDPCEIYGQNTTSAITDLKIYTNDGFNSDAVIVHGTPAGASIGTMYCTLPGYSQSCEIDASNNNKCLNRPSVCDNPPVKLWDDSLTAVSDLDESGDVTISTGIIVANPCPAFTLVFNSCLQLSGGSTVARAWIKNSIDTTGYDQIELHFGMNVVGAENGEHCRVFYSIDNSLNWVEVAAYDQSTFYTDFILPAEASDNPGLRIMFEMDADSNGDRCYLNDGM